MALARRLTTRSRRPVAAFLLVALLSSFPAACADVVLHAAQVQSGAYSGGEVRATVDEDGRTVHWERTCMVAPSDAGIRQATTFVLEPSGDGLNVVGRAMSAEGEDPCGPPSLASRWHAFHLAEGDFLVSEADLPELLNRANSGGSPSQVGSLVLRRSSGNGAGQWPAPSALIPSSWTSFLHPTPLVARMSWP